MTQRDIVARLRDNSLVIQHPERDQIADEIERLRAALETCASWIDRWTPHAGNCKGGDKCTCGRTAVLFDASAALNEQITHDKE